MESSRQPEANDPLQLNVRRMQEAIRQSHLRQPAYLDASMHQSAWPMSRRARRRLERQLARQARREGWSRRRGPGWVPTIIFFSLGLWLLSVSTGHPGAPNRWLGFAFILGAIALVLRRRLRLIEGKRSRPGEREQDPERPSLDSKQAQTTTRGELDRTEMLCDKLIQELRASPQVLRNIVQRPEETIVSLRTACAALREREQSIRALVTQEDSERLEIERRGLARRVGSETDEVVRERLSSALKSLDDQVKQRSNLLTSAARLEAERTRIHYALENLYTQVMSLKSADSASADVAGSGLRQSLSRLSDEVSAVAESLEATSRGDESILAAVSPVSSGPDRTLPNRADRERS